MLIQIIAQKNDTLETCLVNATFVSKTLGLNVIFYYNRIGYYVVPSDTPASAKERSEMRDQLGLDPGAPDSPTPSSPPTSGTGPVGPATTGVGGTKASK